VDRIGPFPFIRLSKPPERVQSQWEIGARAGTPGVAMWDTGERGEPFTVESQAVATTFAVGRTYLLDYLTLVKAGYVPVWFGTLEPQQLYKVLKVKLVGPGVKSVPRAHVANDTTLYQALVFAEWELMPLDPYAQRP
jgi:hypothetical protein